VRGCGIPAHFANLLQINSVNRSALGTTKSGIQGGAANAVESEKSLMRHYATQLKLTLLLKPLKINAWLRLRLRYNVLAQVSIWRFMSTYFT
jgi:hypothetical protein